MSLRNHLLIRVLLAILSMTPSSEGAGTMLISVIPPTVKEFTGYTIRCQYPPPGVNASTTGVLQVTHQSPPSDDVIIYSHDFDANSDTFNSAIQTRATFSLNKTAAVIVVDVQVAYATDTGRYTCSLPDTTTNTTITASPMTLNVTGCVGGSQLDRIIGCPSVSVGLSCSVFCSSNIENATVSLSRYINGSPQIVSDLNEVNYTISSVQDSDFGNYFCYVRTPSCNSMADISVTPAPATTSPPGCDGNGGCSGGRRLPGWAIALIVIACVIFVVILIALIIFFLNKKGILHRDKERGVQPTSGGQGRTIANDNYAMSDAKSAGGKKDRNGKSSSSEVNNSTAVVSFPEVKTRKSQLPPLEPMTQGWNRRQTEDNSPDVAKRRPLPKRTSDDDNASPEVDRRRRSSQVRRHSDDEGGSPERGGGRVPPIQILSHRGRDEDDEPGRF